MLIVFHFLALCCIQVFAAYVSKAWQNRGHVLSLPEDHIAEISRRPSTALSFSGGGARAYNAAIGYLAGFHKLDLMENIRYVGGISGGLV